MTSKGTSCIIISAFNSLQVALYTFCFDFFGFLNFFFSWNRNILLCLKLDQFIFLYFVSIVCSLRHVLYKQSDVLSFSLSFQDIKCLWFKLENRMYINVGFWLCLLFFSILFIFIFLYISIIYTLLYIYLYIFIYIYTWIFQILFYWKYFLTFHFLNDGWLQGKHIFEMQWL